MTLNNYGDLVAKWKIELIVARAKRMGFRGADLEDAGEKVILDVLNFQYDPNHSKGASEKTALEVVIDHRLCKLRGNWGDYESDAAPLDGIEQEPHYFSTSDQEQDVRATWSKLSPQEQEVCQLLFESCSPKEIARRMGCHPSTVKRLIQNIRQTFRDAGLEPPENRFR